MAEFTSGGAGMRLALDSWDVLALRDAVRLAQTHPDAASLSLRVAALGDELRMAGEVLPEPAPCVCGDLHAIEDHDRPALKPRRRWSWR